MTDPEAPADATDAPAAKRRKTLRDAAAEALAAASAGRQTPKEELMPPIPPVPPLATTERTNVRPSSIWRWGDKHDVPPPAPIYTPADTALWPEEAAELYRATKVNSDQKGASNYMRWWFDNHRGMPARVPKIPRSAFSLYYSEQKGIIHKETGRWDQKKDGKRVGAMWKALTEEERRPYAEDPAVLKEQKESNEEWYRDRLEAWRKERRERLVAEGAELDPAKRRKAGLEPLCECRKCGPIDGEAPPEGAGGWSMH